MEYFMQSMHVEIDGEWREIPNDARTARDLKWHRGATYDHALYYIDSKYYDICDWCKEMYKDDLSYRTFTESIWFYREKDAIMCMLRWGEHGT
jgi:hypothetical protein